MEFLKVSFEFHRRIVFHHISVEALRLEVAKLVFGNGSVCQYEIVLLSSLFDIVIKDFTNLSGRLDTVNRLHLNIHHYKLIGILTVLYSLRTLHYCLFSTTSLISLYVEILLEHHFQYLEDKDGVVDQKDLIIFFCLSQFLKLTLRLPFSIFANFVFE